MCSNWSELSKEWDVLFLVRTMEMGSYWSGRLRCALIGLDDGNGLFLVWMMEMGSSWSGWWRCALVGLDDGDGLFLVWMMEMGSSWSGWWICALIGLDDGDGLFLVWMIEMCSYWSGWLRCALIGLDDWDGLLLVWRLKCDLIGLEIEMCSVQMNILAKTKRSWICFSPFMFFKFFEQRTESLKSCDTVPLRNSHFSYEYSLCRYL